MKNRLKKIAHKDFAGRSFEYYCNHKERSNGSYKKFYKNGCKYLEGYDINGTATGLYKWFEESGINPWIETYKNGQLNGVTIKF